MATASSGTPKFQVFTPNRIEGDIVAIGPTNDDGKFLVYILGKGFQYIDCSDKVGKWVAAASFEGSIAGAFGLHMCPARGDATAMHVSFVDAQLRSWVCLRLPESSIGADVSAMKAESVAHAAMPADIKAVCSAPGDAVAALALANSSLRFCDLLTGQTCGKGLKLEPRLLDVAMALVRLGPGRFALIRDVSTPSSSSEFCIVEFDDATQQAMLQFRGTLGGLNMLGPTPSSDFSSRVLVNASVAGTPSQPGQDRVILCWRSVRPGTVGGDSSTGSPSNLVFASATLDKELAEIVPLLTTEQHAGSTSLPWLCISGYFVEWITGIDGAPKNVLSMRLRDERFGMIAASGEIPFAADNNIRTLTSTAGSTTILAGGKNGASFAAVRWSLQKFSLQTVIGMGIAQPTESCKSLAPLHGAIYGKRPRDDSVVKDLFSAKHNAVTDKALAVELKNRRWEPSHALVDTIVQNQCWAAGSALLSLPELDENLSIRLLAARVELLPYIVRRARAPHMLEFALRDYLPASLLPGILEVLLQWLEAYRDFPENVVQKAAPGIPRPFEIVNFTRALADGCSPSLAVLEKDLIERIVETMNSLHVDFTRTNRLSSTVRAACWMTKPLQPASDAPAVEVMHLSFETDQSRKRKCRN